MVHLYLILACATLTISVRSILCCQQPLVMVLAAILIIITHPFMSLSTRSSSEMLPADLSGLAA